MLRVSQDDKFLEKESEVMYAILLRVETLFDGLHVHFYHGSQTRLEVLLHGKKVE